MKRLSILVISLCMLLLMLSCEKKDSGTTTTSSNNTTPTNTIKIGQYGSLTGDTATFGTSTRDGIGLAVDQVNKAGGLLGKQIEMIVEDDRSQQPEAKSAVQKLIDKDKVIAVLGEVASSRSIAGGQVCQDKGIPMISPSSTNPQVTEIGDFIFRVCYLDDFQGKSMALFAANALKAKKVAILYDKSSDYSDGLKKFFGAAFKEYGGEIVQEEAFQTTDADFSAQLTSIVAKNPDAIYVPAYYGQVGQIAQQARKLGYSKPLLGGDGWDSPTLIEIGKDAMNGCYFTNHYTVQDPDPDVQNYVKSYQEKYKAIPDALSALGYDAARILFEAIKKAGSTDPKAIRDAIKETKDFKAVTGKITIDPKTRNAQKSIVVIGIEGGKYAVKGSVSPNYELTTPK